MAGALARDHDGTLLDNMGSLLGGASSDAGIGGLLGMAGSLLTDAPGPGSAKTVDGAGILGHILGAQRPQVEQNVAQASGMDLSKVTQLLPMIAPLIMGALGKAKQQNGLDAGGLGALIAGASSMLGGAQQAPAAGGGLGGAVLGGLLGGDKDGDGSMLDDIAGAAAGSVLGGLFK